MLELLLIYLATMILCTHSVCHCVNIITSILLSRPSRHLINRPRGPGRFYDEICCSVLLRLLIINNGNYDMSRALSFLADISVFGLNGDKAVLKRRSF